MKWIKLFEQYNRIPTLSYEEAKSMIGPLTGEKYMIYLFPVDSSYGRMLDAETTKKDLPYSQPGDLYLYFSEGLPQIPFLSLETTYGVTQDELSKIENLFNTGEYNAKFYKVIG